MDRRTFLIRSLGASGVVLVGACTGAQDTPETGDGAAPAPTGTAETTSAAARRTLRLPGEDTGFPSPFAYRRGPGTGR